MNILFDIAHPADVHMYRYVRTQLIERGHSVIFMARDKDVVLELLDAYQIPYEEGTTAARGRIGLSFELICWFFKAFSVIFNNKIDITISLSSPATAWAAKLQGVPHIMFNDTETGVAQLRMARPATKHIYTPECLLADWGIKQIRYKCIHDLAYLHPKYFQPASKNNVYKLLTESAAENSKLITLSQKYAIIRFVSWDAAHDRGAKRTTFEFQTTICTILKKNMKIFITAEGDLPENLEQFRLKAPPNELHNIMSHADLVVSDGATTATEAAVMGVPSIYISTFANSLGYCRLLHKYGLLTSVKGEQEGIDAIEYLINNPD